MYKLKIFIHGLTKVRSSYGPLACFSDIFISGKNDVFSAQKTVKPFCMKIDLIQTLTQLTSK